MPAKFKKSSKVVWKWLGREIEGEVTEIFLEPVTRKIKTKNITRNGSPEKPAYMVKSVSGNFALKLESELQAPTRSHLKKTAAKNKPKMFS